MRIYNYLNKYTTTIYNNNIQLQYTTTIYNYNIQLQYTKKEKLQITR